MSRSLRRDSLPVLSSNNCRCHPARNINFSVMKSLNDDLEMKCLLIAHSGLRSLIAVSVTLSLMSAWYSQVDITCFRLSSLKTVPVFRTP
ncbi:Uncharacterised protein [Klebsiella pneumoniae]|nr:Uncharacterised protein [Klebsiella pneumoniae]